MKNEPNQRLRTGSPSNSEIDGESDLTRKEILAAMQRLLLGHPKHVPPGAYSLSDLAREAKVGRHHLYQGHTDLRDRYEYLRDRGDQPTAKEADLQKKLDSAKAEVARLRQLQAKTKEEADGWRTKTELVARAVNVLQAELHDEQTRAGRLAVRLRRFQELAGEPSTVVLIHRKKQPRSKPSAD